MSGVKDVTGWMGRKRALVIVPDHKGQTGSGVGESSECTGWFIDLTQTWIYLGQGNLK